MANNTIDRRTRRLGGRERLGNEIAKRREAEAETPPPGETSLRTRPANENDPGTAAMVANLRRRPSYAPYYVAFLGCLLWVFTWSLIFSSTFFNRPAPFSAQALPQTVVSLALLGLPILLIWVMAHFMWRAQQMRHVSEALMHSAMRLVRPQDIATEGLSTIAQAVRADVDILVGGVEHAMQRAGELESIVHKEISAIERAFGGNEERIRTLVSGLENQRAALQQAGMVIGNEASPLLSRLETNTQSLDTIIATAQSTLARLEHGLSSTTVELARTIDEVASRASVAGGEISDQTAQMERTSNMLVNELRTFSQHLTNQVDTLTSASSNLNTESSNFGESIQGMETNLVQLLRSSVDELTAINGEITNRLQTASGNILYHLKSTSEEVAQEIEKSGRAVSQQIETSRAGLTHGLHGVVKDYVGQVDRARGELVTFVDQASGQIAQGIDESTAQLFSRLDTAAKSIHENLDQSGAAIEQLLTQARTSLVTYVDQATDQIAGGVDSAAHRLFTKLDGAAQMIHGNIEISGNALIERLTDSTSGVAAQITDTAGSITGKLDEAANIVNMRLQESAGDVMQEMQNAGLTLNELLVTTSGTIASHLKETSEIVTREMQDSGLALAQNIEGSGGLITEKLITVSGEFVENVTSARDDLFTLLDRASNQMTDKLQETTHHLFGRLEDTSGQMTSQLEATTLRITDHIGETAGQVTENITRIAADLTGRLGDTSMQITAQLERASGDLSSELVRTSSELTSRFETTSGDMTSRLEHSSGALGEKLDRLSGQMTVHLDRASSELTERLERASSQMTSQLEGTSSRLFEHVEQANTVMADRLDVTATEVAERLSNAGKTMFSRIDTTARDLGQRFDVATELLEKITTDISGRMETVSGQFAQTLEKTGGQILTDIDRVRNVFSEGLSESSLSVAGHLEQQAGQVTTRISAATREFEQAALGTTQRLEDAGAKFASHLEGTNAFLAEQLSTAANTIDDRLEGVSLELTGKLENAGGRIFERLDTVSGAVQRSLDRFNSDMERVLSNREEALGQLIAALGKKAQDVDEMMRDYMSLIEKSMAGVEARSTEIGRLISEQTSEATTSLEREITRLENTSGEQITTAARVLREQQERAIAAMNEIMSGTAQDFQQTAQNMRTTAQQVVTDIAAVRAEVNSAILDLPDETRANADAMRKVVSDQIAALTALADVIKKQAGGLDISGPGLYAPTPNDEAKTEPATLSPSLNGSSSAQEARPRDSQATPLPVLETHSGNGAEKSNAEATGDLSHETESLMQKLNGVARDLVEVTDGTVPADLEQRYLAGESHVYTHLLFEERGSRVRRMIRNRYHDDKILRERVDSYVRLFERLLDTVSATSQGKELADACLASESGKLYLLMANASGRTAAQ